MHHGLTPRGAVTATDLFLIERKVYLKEESSQRTRDPSGLLLLPVEINRDHPAEGGAVCSACVPGTRGQQEGKGAQVCLRGRERLGERTWLSLAGLQSEVGQGSGKLAVPDHALALGAGWFPGLLQAMDSSDFIAGLAPQSWDPNSLTQVRRTHPTAFPECSVSWSPLPVSLS